MNTKPLIATNIETIWYLMHPKRNSGRVAVAVKNLSKESVDKIKQELENRRPVYLRAKE